MKVTKTSKAGLDLIKKYEGLHDGSSKAGLQPKMDPIGIWTEGYGRAMRDYKGNFIKGLINKPIAYKHQTIFTELDAVNALAQDLKVYERIISQKIKVELNQNQFDALVSYIYNTGGSSTLYNLINNSRPKSEIYKWWTTKYISAGGRVLTGLVKRRKEEAALFFKT